MAKTRVEVATLQALAEGAANKVFNELGMKAECVYLGQATGSEPNRVYLSNPGEWTVEAGA